ncbi:adenosylcobinamide-GDP ribazoletransferase [Pseudonocardia spinosispora]|uniref:adenosylcobinamide-GDP ribazoletransferase n=1 Tax=Pseudonocardia spinosispora TaxID=103441 RepID=UPI000427B770|nr:adenosylcobinamide-GDP ribazoletransferase [Pseudonocardia spinosispora]
MTSPLRDGPRLALSWLTVLPVRGPATVDRTVAGAAIGWAPLPGVLLGALATGLLYGLDYIGMPGPPAGLLVVAVLALATRGMHLDGLADTADGLGCYGAPDRALAVMRDGGAGPFAVATLVLVLGLQATALGQLAGAPHQWPSVLIAVLAGRCAFGWCCRRGIAAARPEGLGALVAGTQRPWAAMLPWVPLSALATFAVPDRPWQGPLAVVLAATLVVVLSAHTTRRFGGVTGDVLGAATELTTTTILLCCLPS